MEPSLQYILVAIGSFFFFMTLIFALIYKLCKHRNKQAPATELSSVTVDESAATLNRIDMGELVRATRDFSQDLIIGCGSFGLVYRAKLSSGVIVAVKKLAADAFQGFREFRAEMETLVKIRHPNIVKILGYCAAGSDLILIYEFVENGSLDQWLHDTSSSVYDVVETGKFREPLNWKTRIKTVQGVARGLAYLHSLDTPIIHRDIKTSNILLDAEYGAHITDFGFARQMKGSHSHVSTQVAGTMGYMPPEYMKSCNMATIRGDVYSFGVLMLETVTGRQPNFLCTGGGWCEVSLVKWVTNMVSQNRYMEMVDANISKEALPKNDIINYFAIATMYVSENPKDRPTMNDVVGMLE